MMITDKSGVLYNAADRDHCMQYIVALVLLKGQLIEARDYQDDSPRASDPQIAKLREKMVLGEDQDFSNDYYDLDRRSAATSVSILFKDGSRIERVVHLPKGHPDAVGTEEGIARKLQKNLRPRFADEEIETLGGALEHGEMPVREYVNLWLRDKDPPNPPTTN